MLYHYRGSRHISHLGGKYAPLNNEKMSSFVQCKTPAFLRNEAERDPLCSAVDNLLGKLAAESVPFLRIGRRSQVEPRLHDWMPGGSRYPDTSARGLAATAAAARVVSLPSVHACLDVRSECAQCCNATGRQTCA